MIKGKNRKKLIKALKDNKGIELTSSVWNSRVRIEAVKHSKPVAFVDLEYDVKSGGYIPTFFQIDRKYRKKGVATALFDIASEKLKVTNSRDSEYGYWMRRIGEDKWDKVVEIPEAKEYEAVAGVPGSNLFRSSEGEISEEEMEIFDDEGRIEITCDGGELNASYVGGDYLTEYYFESDIERGNTTLEEIEETFPYEAVVELEYLQVEPDKRGEGVATSLMKKFIEIVSKFADTIILNASPMGMHQVDLGTIYRFYEKFGFQEFLNQGGNVIMYKHITPVDNKSVAKKTVPQSKDDILNALNIEVDEDFVKKWFDHTLSTDSFEGYAEYLYKDKYEDDEDHPKEWGEMSYEEQEPYLKEFAEDYLEDRVDEFYGEFSYTAESDGQGIIAWRHINVENPEEFINLLKEGKYLKDFDGIGTYWAWDEDKAEAHWGGKGESLILKASVPFSSINVEDTLFLNLDYSLGREEAELRLNEGAPLIIKEIEIEGGETLTDMDLKAIAEY